MGIDVNVYVIVKHTNDNTFLNSQHKTFHTHSFSSVDSYMDIDMRLSKNGLQIS